MCKDNSVEYHRRQAAYHLARLLILTSRGRLQNQLNTLQDVLDCCISTLDAHRAIRYFGNNEDPNKVFSSR